MFWRSLHLKFNILSGSQKFIHKTHLPTIDTVYIVKPIIVGVRLNANNCRAASSTSRVTLSALSRSRSSIIVAIAARWPSPRFIACDHSIVGNETQRIEYLQDEAEADGTPKCTREEDVKREKEKETVLAELHQNKAIGSKPDSSSMGSLDRPLAWIFTVGRDSPI